MYIYICICNIYVYVVYSVYVRRAFYKALINTSRNTFGKSSLRFARDADLRILASCAHGGVSAKGLAKNFINMNEYSCLFVCLLDVCPKPQEA